MKKRFLTLFVILNLALVAYAQEKDTLKKAYHFQMIYSVKTTPVKSQYRTGTCWDFATVSFVETELLRKGKGEFDLSEMYIVRETYPQKAERYIRFHGNETFSQGGQAHDVLNTIAKFGIVPESVYNGNVEDPKTYNHNELFDIMKGMLSGVMQQKHPSEKWEHALENVLDVYLGKPPVKFDYKGESYTPKSFLNSLDFDISDYVELTSFTHHPFYSKFVLEVPDNWAHAEYYNIPLDELIEVMKTALKLGYSIAWDGDVGKEYFKRFGVALVPKNIKDSNYPIEEKEITQQLRQKEFDNFQTTDDHLMHIVGLAKDQRGTEYFYTKNSWGTKRGYEGYWYMSESYVRLKTIAIMVHKNAIPQKIREKLGI